MERNKNVSRAKFDILMEKEKNRVSHRKNKRLKRNPAMEIEAPQTQKIFSDSRQA